MGLTINMKVVLKKEYDGGLGSGRAYYIVSNYSSRPRKQDPHVWERGMLSSYSFWERLD